MTGDRLIFYIALGAAIAMIVLIMTGCAEHGDMSRREAIGIVDLEKAVRRCPGEPVCKGWNQ